MMLEDPEMISATEQIITQGNISAPQAFKRTTDNFIALFEQMDNAYMRERALDLKDIQRRVCAHLLGVKLHDLTKLEHPVILVSKDLTPSETATMDKKNVLGFITELGGKTSHSAIMARGMQIPAVVGLGEQIAHIQDQDIIAFDGQSGEVYINPKNNLLVEFEKKQQQFQQRQSFLKKYLNVESKTLDNYPMMLASNIGAAADVVNALANGADGIGLFRTEFLYMDRTQLPSEEEQFEAYQHVLIGMKGKPCIIRTLDIGGDKQLPYLDLGQEMNPFLGRRAIRLCLDRQDIFRTQLRALLRASTHGQLKIMFPMISGVDELIEVKEFYKKIKNELESEGVVLSNKIKLGIMIEVPSAAVMAHQLAKHVDFFSIGTNDLIQYVCAVDRMNESIQHLYSPYHPAVLSLIAHTAKSAKKAGIWVGMCGEMASYPNLLPFLVGVGLDELSMNAGAILETKDHLVKISKKDCEKLVEEILQFENIDLIQEKLNLFMNQYLN